MRFVQHHAHALSIFQFAEGIDAAVVFAEAPRRLVGHRDLGDQVAERRVPSGELDPSRLAHKAATAVASDEVRRSHRTAVGQRDVDAGGILREPRHLDAAIDRDRQLVDPRGEDALDGFLREREPVVVARRKVRDVEAVHREARDLHDLALRQEAVRDPTLIEDLDRAGMQTARAAAGDGLVRASLDDGDVDMR